MPATVRYDAQYCPIARSLDVLGDRWTLLIIRELLLVGDQRFTDLRRQLPGISPTMLTARLRTLTEQGLVAVKELPPPAARTVYTLTPRGRSIEPVLRALARWGVPLLEPPDEHTNVRPATAARVAVAGFFDRDAAADVDERYLLRIDGQEFLLSSVGGGGADGGRAALEIEASGATWIDLRQGRLTVRDAVKSGRVRVIGPKRALTNFQRIFQLA